MATARTRVEIIMAILLMIPPLGTAEHITGHHPRTVMVDMVVVAAAASARLLQLDMEMLRLCLHLLPPITPPRLPLRLMVLPPPPPPTKIPMVVDILRHLLLSIHHRPTVHLRHHHHHHHHQHRPTLV